MQRIGAILYLIPAIISAVYLVKSAKLFSYSEEQKKQLNRDLIKGICFGAVALGVYFIFTGMTE